MIINFQAEIATSEIPSATTPHQTERKGCPRPSRRLAVASPLFTTHQKGTGWKQSDRSRSRRRRRSSAETRGRLFFGSTVQSPVVGELRWTSAPVGCSALACLRGDRGLLQVDSGLLSVADGLRGGSVDHGPAWWCRRTGSWMVT